MNNYRLEFSENQGCFHIASNENKKCIKNSNGYITIKDNCSYKYANNLIKRLKFIEKNEKVKLTVELIKSNI